MTEEYPTVENGMLIKRDSGIYTIARDKKLPQKFKDLILAMIYEDTNVDVNYRNFLLFYNNETYMMIISNALTIDTNDINILNECKNKYSCALITHYDKGLYNCTSLGMNNIKCDNCKIKNSLLLFAFNNDTKSYCSVRCHNEYFKKINDTYKKLSNCDLNNAIICYNCAIECSKCNQK